MGKSIRTREYQDFAIKLRKARREAGLTQVQVAKKLEPISKVVFEQYPHACKMHKPEKIIGFVFVSSNEAAVIL